MTQISGKIYQMTNDAKTENRFPRTVIEAVYGLSSYLQGQFSNLSTIYMPIEGISERKADQSFVFRQTPNTIHANTLQLERIKGKSLAWNQQFYNGDGGDGTSGWQTHANFTLSNVDGKLRVTEGATVPSSGQNILAQTSNVRTPKVVGHKYLLMFDYKVTTSQQAYRMAINFGGVNVGVVAEVNSYAKYSRIITPTGAYATFLVVASSDNTLGEGSYIDFDNIICIDLTLLYGSEISGLTDAQILAKYEAEFGDKYYPNSNGELICNDAKYLESVGFNQWDEEWEVGSISGTGVNQAATDQIRSKNYIPAIPNTTYYFKTVSGITIGDVFFYDINKNFIRGTYTKGNQTFTTPDNCYYIRFAPKANYGPVYNHDICINLSDPTKNGTYEPYWKRVLPVNCDSFKVKSHNIWDEEREGGSFTDGAPSTGPNSFRSKNYIQVFPNNEYSITKGGMNGTTYIEEYDSNKTFIQESSLNVETTKFTLTANTAYIKVAFYKSSSGWGTNIPNYDICINESSSFNGQYEPHGEITVNGLRGAGTAFDEKTATKYVKRVGSVDLGTLSWSYSSNTFASTSLMSLMAYPATSSENGNILCSKYLSHSYTGSSLLDKIIYTSWQTAGSKAIWVKDSAYTDAATFKAAMNGVYLDYELATPIEYELVEPMVTTMKVGITESRVSPNAYGLSTPFVADINYSVNPAANSSESAEYAPLAGRLLNTRKIWGQDFNGSQDVAGALSGVTNVNSLLYFDSANGRVGVGTSSPDKKLTVSGTLKVTDAVTLSSSLSVGTNAVVNGTMSVGTGNWTFILDSNNQSGLKIYGPNNAGYMLFNQSKLGINTTPTHNLHVIGDIYASSSIQSESYITAGLAAASSDARLKDNLKTISQETALSILSMLSGKEWDWNEKMESFYGQHGSGLVAQELQGVMPWAVLDLNGQLSLNYNTLWGIAIPVMQSHEERIKRLEERIGG